MQKQAVPASVSTVVVSSGAASPLWMDVQKLCNTCAFIAMKLLRITLQIPWGTSYSRPPIDPYLTSLLLQNPGGATGSVDCVSIVF